MTTKYQNVDDYVGAKEESLERLRILLPISYDINTVVGCQL